jgi:hypothetical protein
MKLGESLGNVKKKNEKLVIKLIGSATDGWLLQSRPRHYIIAIYCTNNIVFVD